MHNNAGKATSIATSLALVWLTALSPDHFQARRRREPGRTPSRAFVVGYPKGLREDELPRKLTSLRDEPDPPNEPKI